MYVSSHCLVVPSSVDTRSRAYYHLPADYHDSDDDEEYRYQDNQYAGTGLTDAGSFNDGPDDDSFTIGTIVDDDGRPVHLADPNDRITSPPPDIATAIKARGRAFMVEFEELESALKLEPWAEYPSFPNENGEKEVADRAFLFKLSQRGDDFTPRLWRYYFAGKSVADLSRVLQLQKRNVAEKRQAFFGMLADPKSDVNGMVEMMMVLEFERSKCLRHASTGFDLSEEAWREAKLWKRNEASRQQFLKCYDDLKAGLEGKTGPLEGDEEHARLLERLEHVKYHRDILRGDDDVLDFVEGLRSKYQSLQQSQGSKSTYMLDEAQTDFTIGAPKQESHISKWLASSKPSNERTCALQKAIKHEAMGYHLARKTLEAAWVKYEEDRLDPDDFHSSLRVQIAPLVREVADVHTHGITEAQAGLNIYHSIWLLAKRLGSVEEARAILALLAHCEARLEGKVPSLPAPTEPELSECRALLADLEPARDVLRSVKKDVLDGVEIVEQGYVEARARMRELEAEDEAAGSGLEA